MTLPYFVPGHFLFASQLNAMIDAINAVVTGEGTVNTVNGISPVAGNVTVPIVDTAAEAAASAAQAAAAAAQETATSAAAAAAAAVTSVNGIAPTAGNVQIPIIGSNGTGNPCVLPAFSGFTLSQGGFTGSTWTQYADSYVLTANLRDSATISGSPVWPHADMAVPVGMHVVTAGFEWDFPPTLPNIQVCLYLTDSTGSTSTHGFGFNSEVWSTSGLAVEVSQIFAQPIGATTPSSGYKYGAVPPQQMFFRLDTTSSPATAIVSISYNNRDWFVLGSYDFPGTLAKAGVAIWPGVNSGYVPTQLMSAISAGSGNAYVRLKHLAFS